MKVAIAGAGNVGTAIAKDLAANGHDVLLIERDPDLVERLRSTVDVTWVAADACEVDSLDAAGMAQVDVAVAATGDDEDNLVISLLAKQEFAVPRVVARVNHPSNQWLFNESWGVDISVSTPQLLTALVEEAVSVGSLVRLLQFERGNAHLVEVTLAEGSPAAGTSLVDLQFPRDATVVAVVRGDRLVVPRGRHRARRRGRGHGARHRGSRERPSSNCWWATDPAPPGSLREAPRTGMGPYNSRHGGGLLRSRQDDHRPGVDGRLRPPLLPGRPDLAVHRGEGPRPHSWSTCTSVRASRSWPESASRC